MNSLRTIPTKRVLLSISGFMLRWHGEVTYGGGFWAFINLIRWLEMLRQR